MTHVRTEPKPATAAGSVTVTTPDLSLPFEPPNPPLEICGLFPAEASKVGRLAARLTSVFRAAGYAIGSCQGAGSGPSRVLEFCVGRFGPAVLTFRAAEFAACGDDDAVGAVRVALSPSRPSPRGGPG
jgi:hypothetical protein